MTPVGWTFGEMSREARRRAREAMRDWSQGWHNADILVVSICAAAMVAAYYYLRAP